MNEKWSLYPSTPLSLPPSSQSTPLSFPPLKWFSSNNWKFRQMFLLSFNRCLWSVRYWRKDQRMMSQMREDCISRICGSREQHGALNPKPLLYQSKWSMEQVLNMSDTRSWGLGFNIWKQWASFKSTIWLPCCNRKKFRCDKHRHFLNSFSIRKLAAFSQRWNCERASPSTSLFVWSHLNLLSYLDVYINMYVSRQDVSPLPMLYVWPVVKTPETDQKSPVYMCPVFMNKARQVRSWVVVKWLHVV